jgi:hypothetical protein
MRRVMRGGVMLLVVGSVMVGGAGIAAASPQPKSQSVAKYAKTVCGTYQNLLNDLTNFGSGIAGLDPTDPSAFQTQASAQTAAIIAKIKAAEKTLAAAYPNISNGQKTGKLLATNAKQLDTLLTSAEGKLATGGVAGATQFTVAIQTLATKLSDPFSKVTNQSLINAFQKEKLCKNVVEVEPG